MQNNDDESCHNADDVNDDDDVDNDDDDNDDSDENHVPRSCRTLKFQGRLKGHTAAQRPSMVSLCFD